MLGRNHVAHYIGPRNLQRQLAPVFKRSSVHLPPLPPPGYPLIHGSLRCVGALRKASAARQPEGGCSSGLVPDCCVGGRHAFLHVLQPNPCIHFKFKQELICCVTLFFCAFVVCANRSTPLSAAERVCVFNHTSRSCMESPGAINSRFSRHFVAVARSCSLRTQTASKARCKPCFFSTRSTRGPRWCLFFLCNCRTSRRSAHADG